MNYDWEFQWLSLTLRLMGPRLFRPLTERRTKQEAPYSCILQLAIALKQTKSADRWVMYEAARVLTIVVSSPWPRYKSCSSDLACQLPDTWNTCSEKMMLLFMAWRHRERARVRNKLRWFSGQQSHHTGIWGSCKSQGSWTLILRPTVTTW